MELTASQLGDVLQILLERIIEGIMNRRQLRQLSERLLAHMLITQERNEKSRVAHCRKRVSDLLDLGISCSTLDCCDDQVAL